MNTYKTVELGSACELVMGQSPSSDTYNSDGIGLPFFQGNADFGEEHPTPSTWCSEPKKTARKGDVLISVRAPIGAVNTATEECCIGRGVAAIRPDGGLLNSAFLKYHLIAKRPELERAGTGSTFTTVGKKALSKLEVRLYGLDDQLKMSRRLDVLSENIRTAREQLTMLDYLVKSRFIEMFGDYDLAPQKREWASISSVGIVVGGATPKTKVDAYWGGNAVWITPAELKDGDVFVDDSARKLTPEGIKSASLTLMPRNTVILSSRAPIGKVAIANCDLYCNQGFKNIICGDTLVPRYLYELLRFNSNFLNSLGKGATFKEISKKTVEGVRIPVPPISSQREYESFACQVDKLRFDVQQQIEKLQMLKKSLMQEYFG